jgi:hypothetical protein
MLTSIQFREPLLAGSAILVECLSAESPSCVTDSQGNTYTAVPPDEPGKWLWLALYCQSGPNAISIDAPALAEVTITEMPLYITDAFASKLPLRRP